ncbi:MAG: orotate phosphoribosyltransferase [Alphaproteobacteria bacterium]|nr:MAG: orotate phosphoribosyltransferase [Alphaproteobacteria bacterium]
MKAERGEEFLDEFRSAGALLEGHFLLSSGRHSAAYLQCARVMMDPARGARLCAALADRVRAAGIAADLCVSPAMGGVIVGYETARQLGLPSIFVERVEGEFTLRRGFEIAPGARVLVVEDVVTTGLSSRECMAAVDAAGGRPVGLACLVDRSGGGAEFDVPFVPLIRLDVPSYAPDAIPPELAALPAVKPGSRMLRS